MSTVGRYGWRADFNLSTAQYPGLFTSKEQLTSAVPQAHVLRHAFDLLNLDGILCVDNTPLIYFKEVEPIEPANAAELHRHFWNHGGAPILVLVSQTQVQVYSGMVRPVPSDLAATLPSLVVTLDRVATELSKFLISVESGEFFHRYSRAFDPAQRVDRDLLTNLRDARQALAATGGETGISPPTLDALLCRLVFTCYLFDRRVVDAKYLVDAGLPSGITHLRDVLNIRPESEAKSVLYKLFEKLGEDFNGDLFSGDLIKEADAIGVEHIRTLADFFQGTRVKDGQRSFWPYDFGYIPIEAISAIYEYFLAAEDQRDGAFYTPRFLVELVLESALRDVGTLLGKRFLDPACGSGIFLVGLFNRIAEEWIQKNPTAHNEQRATELMRLMQGSLFGVDINPTACRITAFSLYLAYLDKLSPRDIRSLRDEGGALPKLLGPAVDDKGEWVSGNVLTADFFDETAPVPRDVHVVVGNPPWGSIAGPNTPAGRWCVDHNRPMPDSQIAVAFIWKAAEHVAIDGHICLVLPHGILFNHARKAVAFQRSWSQQHTLRWVLNLADLRQFLFNEAIHPAIVVSYRGVRPAANSKIDYLVPKADWQVMLGEVVVVPSIDRSLITFEELARDLAGPDAPQVWTQRFWGSPRDIRLIDRLALYPRLRDHIKGSEKGSGKHWEIAEGFQPVGRGDHASQSKSLDLPADLFVPATSRALDLFLLPTDCERLPETSIAVRARSNSNIAVFRAPHVLVTKGFQRIAFANFDVAFRHALRGIHGPAADSDLLAFLAAYLRTPLARFFLFHTSSNWGVYRPEVHVQELLRLPMPLPGDLSDPARALAIVREVANIVARATVRASEHLFEREQAVHAADALLTPLVSEYFSLSELDQILIQDTTSVLIPSIQPSYEKMPVPSIVASTALEREKYLDRLCSVLNGWSRRDTRPVTGFSIASDNLGVAVAVLTRGGEFTPASVEDADALLAVLDRLRSVGTESGQALVTPRDLMVFDGDRLYLVKPTGRRYWTETAALNDADQLAATILMQPEGAAA